MKYLWDTDSCIYFLKGEPKITRKVHSVGVDSICTTIVNIIELKYGAYNSARVEENLQRIEGIQLMLPVLDTFDDKIVTFFAKTKALLRKQGVTISDLDLLIAGFANSYNLCVVTNNTKHFGRIPGITIENWIT